MTSHPGYAAGKILTEHAARLSRCWDMSKEPVKPAQPPEEEPGKPYPVENPPAPEPNEDRPLADPMPPNEDLPRMHDRGSMKAGQPSQPEGAPDQQPGAVRGA